MKADVMNKSMNDSMKKNRSASLCAVLVMTAAAAVVIPAVLRAQSPPADTNRRRTAAKPANRTSTPATPARVKDSGLATSPESSNPSGGGQEPGQQPSSSTTSPAVTSDQPPPPSESATWTANPFVVAPVGLVILIALGLHFVHIAAESRTKQQLYSIRRELQRATAAAGSKAISGGPDRSGSKAADQHASALAALNSKIEELDNHAASLDQAIRHSVDATTVMAEWIGGSKIKELSAGFSSETDETARRRAIKTVARHKELFAENVKRVKEVGDALNRFVADLNGRSHAEAEFITRVESLSEEIREFERWDHDAAKRLKALDRTPFAERDSAFRSRKDQLAGQLNGGEISIAAYVEAYRGLVEQQVSDEASRPYESSDPSEHEERVRAELAAAPDYLMNWFDRLYQLRALVKEGAYPSVDAAAVSELARIQRLGEDALARFDIQPEAIDAGRTGFDRRLHDSALVQRSSLPANTIVAVQQYGFRRLSTGDVLRRPRVVVSGAGAI